MLDNYIKILADVGILLVKSFLHNSILMIDENVAVADLLSFSH